MIPENDTFAMTKLKKIKQASSKDTIANITNSRRNIDFNHDVQTGDAKITGFNNLDAINTLLAQTTTLDPFKLLPLNDLANIIANSTDKTACIQEIRTFIDEIKFLTPEVKQCFKDLLTTIKLSS